jgi:hypothetical protein
MSGGEPGSTDLVLGHLSDTHTRVTPRHEFPVQHARYLDSVWTIIILPDYIFHLNVDVNVTTAFHVPDLDLAGDLHE